MSPSSPYGEKESLSDFDYEAWSDEVSVLHEKLTKQAASFEKQLNDFDRKLTEKKSDEEDKNTNTREKKLKKAKKEEL